MMSICLRSFLRVFISCSGSLWIPTQQPFTKILVALQSETTRQADTTHQSKFAQCLFLMITSIYNAMQQLIKATLEEAFWIRTPSTFYLL